MQQRRLQLGDTLDDYCPRERRITNHAVVAMIDEEVRQTRCTTCDADHEYRHAKVPTPRKKKDAADVVSESGVANSPRPSPAVKSPSIEVPVQTATEPQESIDDPNAQAPSTDEGPVHRRLIRATLPRPEGQVPERREPEFTVRQPGSNGSREERHRPGHRRGRGRRQRSQQSNGQSFSPGNQSNGSSGRQGRGDVNGNRAPSGQRGTGKTEAGHGRGPRHGSGHGRKHGR
jgi:hypothetical protein